MSMRPPSERENPYAVSSPVVGKGVDIGLRAAGEGQWVVEYDLTVDDLISFSLFHHFQSRQLRWQRGLVAVVTLGFVLFAGVIGLPIIVQMLFAVQARRVGLLVVAVFVLFIVSVVFRMLFRQRNNLRRVLTRVYQEDSNDAILGWHRAVLTTEQIHIQAELISTSVSWSAIKKIVRAPTLVCCYYSAINSIIIPLRAFSDETEIDRFLALANEFVKKSRVEGRGQDPCRLVRQVNQFGSFAN